ncbi:MAG: cysteine--tRNA ligase [Candidatus Saccharimonadales bacterium]
MKLYNTLTKKVQDINPINSPKVSVYSCGPTVYDHAHVGHWFTYIRVDSLIRTLRGNGLKPRWVMNITDVGHLTSDADEGEDKLEKGAKREGKTAWEVATKYTEEFITSMHELNMLRPDFIVKATEHIGEQIELIKVLEKKGYTYLTSDGVYFDTSKFPRYRDFAGLDLDEQQPGKRVEFNPEKKNPTDFAVWKFSPKDKKRDMEWPSPWGTGFPGWHIECSAMCMKYLGATIDIHCGGIDHIPIHHTNEIAQSEAATGKKFANYWFHTNHVLIDGQKISKSLGNGITLKDVKEKGYSPLVLRLHVLESHYRSQSRFSWDSLKAARQRLNELQAMAVLRYQAKEETTDYATFALSDVAKEVLAMLSNDLNTPGIMAYLSDVATQLLTVGIEKDMVDHFEDMLKNLDDLLGLKLYEIKDLDKTAGALIAKRQEYRDNQQWDKADNLRQKLLAMNIAIEDKPNGPQWSWVNLG